MPAIIFWPLMTLLQLGLALSAARLILEAVLSRAGRGGK